MEKAWYHWFHDLFFSPPPPVPLAIEEHKDQNKQLYIFSRYFARFEKLVCHINARAAYVRNVQEQGTKERHMSIGDCTKLHNEQPGDFVLLTKYQLDDQMKRKNVARMGKNRRAYKLLVGKPEGNGALGRPRRRWDGNMKTDSR